MGINKFIAHFGDREEIQLSPLIATRVFIVPEDLGFQSCLFIFIHSKSSAWQGWQNEADHSPHALSLRRWFNQTVDLMYITLPHSIVHELKGPNKNLPVKTTKMMTTRGSTRGQTLYTTTLLVSLTAPKLSMDLDAQTFHVPSVSLHNKSLKWRKAASL